MPNYPTTSPGQSQGYDDTGPPPAYETIYPILGPTAPTPSYEQAQLSAPPPISEKDKAEKHLIPFVFSNDRNSLEFVHDRIKYLETGTLSPKEENDTIAYINKALFSIAERNHYSYRHYDNTLTLCINVKAILESSKNPDKAFIIVKGLHQIAIGPLKNAYEYALKQYYTQQSLPTLAINQEESSKHTSSDPLLLEHMGSAMQMAGTAAYAVGRTAVATAETMASAAATMVTGVITLSGHFRNIVASTTKNADPKPSPRPSFDPTLYS